MRRPVISAARSGLRALALSLALPWLAAAAGAATVFDNYTGETSENFGTIDVAAAFTPTANFDFTGEAAFVVGQEGETPQDFTLSLYSSTGGSPGAALWTSDDLSVSGSASLVSAIYSGPAIPLQDGAQYFVVLHQLGAVNWWGGGSESVPIYIIEFGSTWSLQGSGDQQFEVFGDPGAMAAPEAPTWFMMLAGLAALGVAGSRTRRAAGVG